jgi:flagellar motor switch protein FliM
LSLLFNSGVFLHLKIGISYKKVKLVIEYIKNQHLIGGANNMSEKMTQSEIDDLFNAMQDGKDLEVEELLKKKDDTYTDYDFDRPDKFSLENLKSLQTIANTFARNFSQFMSASIKMPITFRVNQTIEQIPYSSEYVEKSPKNFYVFCVTDLGNRHLGLGKVILEFDLNMIIPIHKKMMGAKKVQIEEKRRLLTEIEKIALQQWISDLLFPQLHDAFRSVVDLKFKITNIETDAQYAKVTTSTDMIALITFEVQIGEKRTTMKLVIPYMSVEPIIDNLTTENIYEFKVEDAAESKEEIIKTHLSLVKEKIDVELGRSNVTLRELLEFSEGDVMILDKHIQDDLIGYVKEIPKIACKMGRKDNKIAVKVTGFAEKVNVVTQEEVGEINE